MGRSGLFAKAVTFAAVAMAMSVLGCEPQLPGLPDTGTGEEPIIGGQIDNGDPAVALIVYSDNSGSFTCTGTLISPDTILTAAHCAVRNAECNSPGGPATCSNAPAASFAVFGGTYVLDANGELKDPTWGAEVTAVHAHPGYGSDSTGAPFHDVAVLKLDAIQVYSGTAPQPLAWLSSANESPFATGKSFKAVGYGITSASTGAGTGTKRMVNLTIKGHDSETFWYGGGSTNTCSGDSGGPAIASVNGVPTVIGTTSYGDFNCTQTGVNMRVDAERSFLSQYIGGSGDGTGGDTGNWSASTSPALATVDAGQVCSSVNVTASGDASGVKLELSGVHDYRSSLRGTLSHGGVTVEAFPTGTFVDGAGSFSLSDRAVSGFTGSAGGTWTFCLVDTDAYGDTGTLAGWGVHD